MRVWRGVAEPSRVEQYFDHVRKDVVPIMRSLAGFQGIHMMQRSIGESVEVMVITQWDSMESILGFSGSDLNKAVVADTAQAILSSWDETVTHYEAVPS
jgi:heme-degrading monooxygenase HmoA